MCTSIPAGSPNRERHYPMCAACRDDLITVTEKCDSNEGCLRPVLLLKCGHTFHTECINKWFLANQKKEFKTCPICRREMRANDTRKVSFVFGEE